MAARKHSVPREVDFLIWRLVTANPAVTPETLRAFLSREDKSRTVDTKSVTPLDVVVYGMDALASPDALTMLRVMIFSSPTSVQNAVQNATHMIILDAFFSRETRVAAIHNLAMMVAEDSSTLCEGVVRGILKTSAHETHSSLAWIANNAMDSLVLRCPEAVKKVVMAQHVDPDIRLGATRHLGRLFSLYPEESQDILALLISICTDMSLMNEENIELLVSGVSQLIAALTACPKSAQMVMDALLGATKDGLPWRIRMIAVSQFLAAVEAYPESIEEVMEALCGPVFFMGLGTPQTAESWQDKTKRLVTSYIERYVYADQETKVILANGFSAARRLCPSLCMRIVHVLLQDRIDSVPELRAVVVEKLCELFTLVPKVHDKLISTLCLACYDSHKLVRVTALAHLVSIGKEVPMASDLFAKALLKACRSPNSEVRSEALQQLGAAAQAWPKQTSRIVRFLLHGCCDDDSDVRRVMGEMLERILRLCPTEAIDLLKSMVDQVKAGSSAVSGSKRERCDSPQDERRKKRHENEDSAGAQGANKRMSGI